MALLVIVAQVPALLGSSVDADGLVAGIRELVAALADGQAQPATAVIGGGALAVIVVCRRVASRVPGMLLAAAAGIAVMWAVDPAGVPVVLPLSTGLPTPAFDTLTWGDVALRRSARPGHSSRTPCAPSVKRHETRPGSTTASSLNDRADSAATGPG